MSAVVYRAPDRELNLNESDKSRWRNTQTLIAGLCAGEANRRRDGEKNNSSQSVNQVQKDGYRVFRLVDHCFIDKRDLLWEIQGKWRGYSYDTHIRLLID